MISRAGNTSIDPQVLDSGDYQDVCPDCGSTIVGATLDDVLGAVCACQARRTYPLPDEEVGARPGSGYCR